MTWNLSDRLWLWCLLILSFSSVNQAWSSLAGCSFTPPKHPPPPPPIPKPKSEEELLIISVLVLIESALPYSVGTHAFISHSPHTLALSQHGPCLLEWDWLVSLCVHELCLDEWRIHSTGGESMQRSHGLKFRDACHFPMKHSLTRECFFGKCLNSNSVHRLKKKKNKLLMCFKVGSVWSFFCQQGGEPPSKDHPMTNLLV